MGYSDARVGLDNTNLLGQVSVESYLTFMTILFSRPSPFLAIDN